MLIYCHNSSPIEGVDSCSQSTSQSYARMQNREYISSLREVDFSCSGTLDQSQRSMQMRYAKPEVFAQTHCLRPYILEFSHDMDTSINLAQTATLNSTLNNSYTSTNTIDFANNKIEQTNLLTTVENFSTSSPNFRTSSQLRPRLSTVSPMDRIRTRKLALSDTYPKPCQAETFSRTFRGYSRTDYAIGPYSLPRQVPEAEANETGQTRRDTQNGGQYHQKPQTTGHSGQKEGGRIAGIVRCGFAGRADRRRPVPRTDEDCNHQ